MPGYVMWIILGAIIVLFIVWMVFSGKKRKKQEQEAQDLINAVGPGNKVKTIGGICGIVVEVDKEENTFILETGSEATGKCYIKFDKQAIYQTDAVVEAKKPAEETAPEAESTENTPAEKEAAEAPVAEESATEKEATETKE
ncbi:MAG: preprotein translocase subunit YajC [Clostridiales bacterium]|nr:preprotein translocase subunit YajC [Clostridiales bacterium]